MKSLLTIITMSCIAGVFTGCEKYLAHPPDTRARLNSPEKVSQLLGTAYPQANYMAFAESISDNVADKGAGGITNTNVDPFYFRDVRYDQQDSPEFYWNACYAAIAAANQALDACKTAPDPENYRAQKGEALVARAYAHFMLVTFFSKVYDPQTAAQDAGIPYVTEPEKVVFKQYGRKTVAYVYEMIEKDLLAGIPLIQDKGYTVPRYHFTRAASYAFAARFYLFKKDYAKVVQYVNQLFPGNTLINMLRPWNTDYKTITYNELWARYARATEPANLLLVETASNWARNYFRVRYGLDATKRTRILGTYSVSTNVTGGIWAFTNHLYTQGTNNYLLPKINEYFVRASVNAEIGIPYVMVPLFTAEEALFNRAEANLYLNNMSAVLADLNVYASTRINNYDPGEHAVTMEKMAGFYGTSDVFSATISTIMDFKRAEFVQEGMRWFDLLRYKVPVTHTTVDGETHTLGKDDLRRVFQIPETAKLSGVELNPR